MIKIIKYEFVKSSFILLISLLAVIALAVGLPFVSNAGIVFFITLIPLAIYILYIVEVIKGYSEDVNKKTGYLLFMTPYSGYHVVIAKMIATLLKGLLLLGVYLLALLLTLSILSFKETGTFVFVTFEDIQEMLNAISNSTSGMLVFNFSDILLFLLYTIASAVMFVSMVYLAITLTRTIFANNKLGWLVSIALFIGINTALQFLFTATGVAFGLEVANPTFAMQVEANPTLVFGDFMMTQLRKAAIIYTPLSLAISAVMVFFSGLLLEKKVNL